MDDSIDCIVNARINVILLNDADRGAGHITAVAAMLAGTPQIFSNAEVITDYLVDEVTALAVPFRDRRALRTAMERLLTDTALSATLASNAKQYAIRWLSNEAASRRVSSLLASLYHDSPIEPVDTSWSKDFERLNARRVKHAH